MRVVGFVGRKGSGKDTAAAALDRWRGYTRIAYTDPIKALALRINPIVLRLAPPGLQRLDWLVHAYGWDLAKQTLDVRELLQELGTGVRDVVGEAAWLDAWDRCVAERRATAVVVPDVRRLNEADHVRNTGHSLLIRIVRPGLDTTDRHVTETEQEFIPCDVTVTNKGTPHHLQAATLAVVDAWTHALAVVLARTGPVDTVVGAHKPPAGPRG